MKHLAQASDSNSSYLTSRSTESIIERVGIAFDVLVVLNGLSFLSMLVDKKALSYC